MSELIHNPVFWVTVSFVGFVLLALKFGLHKTVATTLDSRAEAIKGELDAAKALREEAEAVLADYKAKQAAHMKEAEEMLANAKREADALRAEAEKSMMVALDARMKSAMERIEQQEQQAINDVRNHVVDITMAAAKDRISQHFSTMSSDDMVRGVLADLERKVH